MSLPLYRICSQTTRYGERCRHKAVRNGLCGVHSRQHSGADVIDPLEAFDWFPPVETLAALDRAVRSPQRDRQQQEAQVTDMRSDERKPAGDKAARSPHRDRQQQEAQVTDMRSDERKPAGDKAARRGPAPSPNKAADAGRSEGRRLQIVPDLPHDDADAPADAPAGGYVFEAPDVIGIDRKRAEYRAQCPDISDDDLAERVALYAMQLSPKTVRTYTAALVPFYRYAEEHGFHPLKCGRAEVESYLLWLMTSGKLSGGDRDRSRPYSKTYFKTFLAALRKAAEAQDLPSPGRSVDIGKLLAGYNRKRGPELPRCDKTELLVDQLVDIERNFRENSTMAAATLRAAVALGCDPDLGFKVGELSNLTFGDIALEKGHAKVAINSGGAGSEVTVPARPGDPACPVAALKDLRTTAHLRMRASRKGRPPTDEQIGAQPVFSNSSTGRPLTGPGLRHMVGEACAAVGGQPSPGRLPQLTAEQRRIAADTASDPKTVRDLALIFHTAFSSSRASEMAAFLVADIEVLGRDADGTNVYTPLVDETQPDGVVTPGILDRIARITEGDLLDSQGESLYANELVLASHNIYARGTKTRSRHENWHPAQPGHPACPLRLLMIWLKTYDRLMQAAHNRRLEPGDPLFASHKTPGQPISNMSRTIGAAVKEATADIGLDPGRYSAHSLRKFRDSYVLSQGGSMTDVMIHDGRSSEVAGLPYAHRNPRDPLAADLVVGIYDKVEHSATGRTPPMKSDTPNPTPAPTPDTDGPEQPEADADTGSENQPEEAPAEEEPPPPTVDPFTEAISRFRLAVDQLRAAGLSDQTIADIADLDLGLVVQPAAKAPNPKGTPAKPRKPRPAVQRPHRSLQHQRGSTPTP